MELKPVDLYGETFCSDLKTVAATLQMAKIINKDQLYEELCCSENKKLQKVRCDATKTKKIKKMIKCLQASETTLPNN